VVIKLLELKQIKKSDPRLLIDISNHYTKCKGFIGRSICYAVLFNDIYYGSIVGGSATLHLIGRDDFFSLTKENKKDSLNNIVNNIFFHIEKVDGKYPIRWFSAAVLKLFREKIKNDWYLKYGNTILGYETLVELPRTGDCYKKDGWVLLGTTKGYTCTRIPGNGFEKFSGRRIWDTKNIRPKLVFGKLI
jgi:hypothetical protein